MPSELAALTAAALLMAGNAAAAQPPASPTVAAPAATPAPLPGICLMSQEQVVGRSKVGIAASERLKQLTQQAQEALAAERDRLEAQAKSLQTRRPTLTPAQLEAQGRALNLRAQALQAKGPERGRQIDATRTRIIGRIGAEARPIIDAAVAEHGCALLLSRDAVLGGNVSNDVTAEVIGKLDAKITHIDFELEPVGR